MKTFEFCGSTYKICQETDKGQYIVRRKVDKGWLYCWLIFAKNYRDAIKAAKALILDDIS